MDITIKSILCPVDFSETSKLAMHYAVAFARHNGASLTLLHVVAPPITSLPGEAGLLNVPQADIQEIAEACQERLQAIIDDLQSEQVPITSEVISGIPFLEIARFADEQGIDLIVMGSRGRTGLSHLLIGSVAERVLRKAPCPVLTVKERGTAARTGPSAAQV